MFNSARRVYTCRVLCLHWSASHKRHGRKARFKTNSAHPRRVNTTVFNNSTKFSAGSVTTRGNVFGTATAPALLAAIVGALAAAAAARAAAAGCRARVAAMPAMTVARPSALETNFLHSAK